jgi:hypothetical protein
VDFDTFAAAATSMMVTERRRDVVNRLVFILGD